MTDLTEDDIRRCLDPVKVLAAIETAFRDRYPSVEIASRTQMKLAGGVFLVMSCYDRARHALGMKLVTVQENPARAEDRIQATYLLIEPDTACPRLSIPANYLTDIRTAATSAVATKFLARDDARELGIFGCGRQAQAHLKVLPLARRFERVLVCGRDIGRTREFVRRVSGDLTIPIDAVDAVTCAAESDVLCTCTNAQVPLFDGHLLRPGTHLNLVGSFQPHVREVDSVTVQRAQVVVETYEGALAEPGDLLIPISEGVITRDHVRADLHELVSSKKKVRRSRDDITLFKSVGCTLEDLVTAELLTIM
jgi:alanine dehydrogenase